MPVPGPIKILGCTDYILNFKAPFYVHNGTIVFNYKFANQLEHNPFIFL